VPLRHLKFVSALAVLLVMTSSPVLNCMSTLYKMNMQEMECCKHMMSDGCDMGQGHESCCQTNSNPSVAAATHPTQVIHLDTGATVFASIAKSDCLVASSHPRITKADDGLPPPAPPGDISILRT
jgi:hypothetical protein